jgi:hypothetical protein
VFSSAPCCRLLQPAATVAAGEADDLLDARGFDLPMSQMLRVVAAHLPAQYSRASCTTSAVYYPDLSQVFRGADSGRARDHTGGARMKSESVPSDSTPCSVVATMLRWACA